MEHQKENGEQLRQREETRVREVELRQQPEDQQREAPNEGHIVEIEKTNIEFIQNNVIGVEC